MTKAYEMNTDQHEQSLRISGYASLFGRRDLGGDIVRRGAFAASLLKLPNTNIPMLFGHETKQPIGFGLCFQRGARADPLKHGEIGKR